MTTKEQTASRPPAFQFYPDKWQSHARRLSDTAYRVYHEIICWMWLHAPDHCSIPKDSEAIACLTALPCDRIATALREIQNPHAALFKEEGENGEYLVSNGLRKEIKKLQVRRDKAVTAAKQRWNKPMRTQCERNANASSKQCSPTPTPIPTPTPVPSPIIFPNNTELKPGVPQTDSGPAAIEIPLIPSHGNYGVTQHQVDEWTELFPGVEVMQTLREIKAWNQANPTRRKTRRGIEKHIVAWLSKEQCKA